MEPHGAARRKGELPRIVLYLRQGGSEVRRNVPGFSSGRGVHSAVLVRFVDTAELEAAKLEKLEE